MKCSERKTLPRGDRHLWQSPVQSEPLQTQGIASLTSNSDNHFRNVLVASSVLGNCWQGDRKDIQPIKISHQHSPASRPVQTPNNFWKNRSVKQKQKAVDTVAIIPQRFSIGEPLQQRSNPRKRANKIE